MRISNNKYNNAIIATALFKEKGLFYILKELFTEVIHYLTMTKFSNFLL